MKTLVVISDSHGNIRAMEKLRPFVAENDYFLFLGDGIADIFPIRKEYFDKTYFCTGNCDCFPSYPTEGVLEVEKMRIFYTHGHRYGVKSGLGNLAKEAKSRGCQVALYGHTHTPLISEIDGVTLINPGSLHLVGDKPVYAYLVVNGDKLTSVLVGDSLR